ncbi:MAG: hypothetical protein HY897_11165 [Deltaproteobacteria bacterium]|nr:hypothetical protein [Deltaproteobacteria bacterium]
MKIAVGIEKVLYLAAKEIARKFGRCVASDVRMSVARKGARLLSLGQRPRFGDVFQSKP